MVGAGDAAPVVSVVAPRFHERLGAYPIDTTVAGVRRMDDESLLAGWASTISW
jgi:hypothetical protein